jgi:predicted DNA-binding transcriptional regulator AlpA
MSDVTDVQTRITQPEAAKLLGDVSIMTIWRWRNNPAMNFPKSIEINGRHYFVRSEVLNWRPPAKPPGAATSKRAPARRNG